MEACWVWALLQKVLEGYRELVYVIWSEIMGWIISVFVSPIVSSIFHYYSSTIIILLRVIVITLFFWCLYCSDNATFGAGWVMALTAPTTCGSYWVACIISHMMMKENFGIGICCWRKCCIMNVYSSTRLRCLLMTCCWMLAFPPPDFLVSLMRCKETTRSRSLSSNTYHIAYYGVSIIVVGWLQ